ncbi:hypothetical protein C8Q80DRAFT_1124139 [Daedaleopsis nitida]|nr:hypothetical protein C8Q80DRAFT_1124139 [Daedaleopsis nitida]
MYSLAYHCRLAAIPAFPGLHRFPQGHNFKQWTGNDSKALMKIIIPTVVGHVPDKMIKCLTSFLDSCYIVRRDSHDSHSLAAMQDLLTSFQDLRTIFEEVGIRVDKGSALPHQHTLFQYIRGIQLFGSPNAEVDEWYQLLAEAVAANDAPAQAYVTLSNISAYIKPIRAVSQIVKQPNLLNHVWRYLQVELNPDRPDPDNIPIAHCLYVWQWESLSVYCCALSVFYAPSELCGPGGMHCDVICAIPLWWQEMAQYNTILVNMAPDVIVLGGMLVMHVCASLSFAHEDNVQQCALVEWFECDGDAPDPATGMWIVRPELYGLYGTTRIPTDFHYSDPLDAFHRYYINWALDFWGISDVCSLIGEAELRGNPPRAHISILYTAETMSPGRDVSAGWRQQLPWDRHRDLRINIEVQAP